MIDHIPSRLTFIENTVRSSVDKITRKQIKAKAFYLCECGNIIEAQTNKVKSGHTKSCGCISKDYPHNATHGLSSHPLNWAWYNIKSRCYKETNEHYSNYGAIGVQMCDEWRFDFNKFYEWCISNGWEPGLQIDKDIKAKKTGILPGLLYSPDWCSIVTAQENCNNKSNNTLIFFNNKEQTIAQWSRELNISSVRIVNRIKAGWSIEETFTKPLRGKK